MKINYDILKYEMMYDNFTCEFADKNKSVSKIMVSKFSKFKSQTGMNDIIPRFSFDIDDNLLSSLISHDCGKAKYDVKDFVFDFFGTKIENKVVTFYQDNVNAEIEIKYSDCEVKIELKDFVYMADNAILDYRVKEAMKLHENKDKIVGHVMKLYNGRFSPARIEQRWKKCQTKKPKIP